MRGHAGDGTRNDAGGGTRKDAGGGTSSGMGDGKSDGPTGGARGAGAADMAGLRHEIETLDEEIIAAVARRVALARRIGEVKQKASEPTLDPGREATVIRRAVEAGRRHGLPDEPVRELFWTLTALCRRAQVEER